MINLLNFKILLTYSSINQTRWILLLIFLKNLFWLIYILIYRLILFIICIFFYYFKISSNFFLNNFSSLNLNLICLMLSFNLARIPPLSFFFIKWIRIFILILNSNLHLIFILIIINSFILIYIYINLINLIIFLFIFKSKLFNNLYTKLNFINFKKLPLLLYFRIILSLIIFFF